jgi:hypothetical protein
VRGHLRRHVADQHGRPLAHQRRQFGPGLRPPVARQPGVHVHHIQVARRHRVRQVGHAALPALQHLADEQGQCEGITIGKGDEDGFHDRVTIK